jgi:hypothetical protein
MICSKTARAIRMAMAHKGLMGKDLAALMDKTPTTVTRWRDMGCDNIKTLDNIASHCDLTLQEMMEMGK